MKRTCLQCQAQIDVPEGSACPQCGNTPVVAAAISEMTMPVRLGKHPVKLNLVLQIDRTGSSGAFTTGIASTNERVLAILKETVQEIVVTVSTHGDLDYGEQYMNLVTQGTPDEALSAIRGVTYAGGGDENETHGQALLTALETMVWSADPMERNILIAFLTADSKDLKDGKTFGQLGKEFKTRRIKLVLVCQPTAKLQELCDAAGGQMIPISNDPSQDELRKVAASLTKTLTIIAGSSGTVRLPAQNA
jgi:hypothetical protein